VFGTFHDIDVQKLTVNSALGLLLYAVLLLLPDLRYGFLNSEARECRAAPRELLNVATRHKEALAGQKMSRCCRTLSWLVGGPPFSGGPCSAEHAVTCLNQPLALL